MPKDDLSAPLTGRSVHLCVDMQRLFGPEGPWKTPWMERTLPKAEAIARLHPERTIFTRFIPPEVPEQMPGTWRRYYERWREVTRSRLPAAMLDLMPPLAGLVPPAWVHDKRTYSAFAEPGLHAHLKDRRADALIVTGAETDMCVLATVLGAVDLGHRVIVVRDAVCSSSDEGHDALMTMYHQRFTEQIEITDTETVLAAWLP